MYKEHFNLNELPFSIAPNPRYLYLTHQHQDALAHLVYGLNSAGGVILLTGEVGTGKTTISRKLLEDIPDNIVIAWIVNPRLSVEELLAAICDELTIEYPKGNHSIKIFTDLISTYLIFAHGLGHNVVLMIDEAQNLSPEVLEQLRLLTNLETSERKLLQIVLLGQPELKTMLERNDLRQLAQRITARYHLHPLSNQETGGYIRHRLAVAGCSRPVFTPRAIKLIYHLSHGTPRLINLLCDRAMLGVYSANAATVHPKHVHQAAIEVLGDAGVRKHPFIRSMMMPSTIVLLLTATGIYTTGVWHQLAQDAAPQQTTLVIASQQAPALKAPAEAVTPATAAADSAEPEALQDPVPEPAEKAAPEKKPVQPTPSEPVISEPLETLPSQTPEVTASTDTGTPDTSLPIKTAVNAAINDISDKPTPPAGDHLITPTPATAWDIIQANGSKTAAFQTLAEIWHSSVISTAGEPCQQLSDNRLSCLKQRTNIWLLRNMNRPALFQITGQDGARHYAVIRFISHGHAIIMLGKHQWRIQLTELKQHWQDHLTVIWLKPPGYQNDIQQGDSGKAIEWLARQLDRIQGTMIPPRQAHNMDEVLVARLKDFQQSEHMTADGIAGILTLMRINERIGLDIPLLMDEAQH